MLVESWMKKCMGAQWDCSLNAMKCDEERERERMGLQLGAVSHWMFRWQ